MIRVAEKVEFQMETLVRVRRRSDNQLLNSCFCCYCGQNSFKMNLESLSFRDRFDILPEKGLSGASWAEDYDFIWEIPDYQNKDK